MRSSGSLRLMVVLACAVSLIASPVFISAQMVAEEAEIKTEPNFVRKLFVFNTNDPDADLLWGHDKIFVSEAWGFASSTADVLVGVIDTGVLYTHPDLSAAMWDGSACLDGSSTTTACIHGYDFVNNDGDPLPSHFHGTHITGTIAASADNGIGVAGVTPRARIAALRIFDDQDTATVEDEIRAIDFAIQNGVKIINASYGGPEFSQSEYDAIKRFRDAGGIFVAAAGNGGGDAMGDSNEISPNYPSDYDLDNIISVAATDQDDNLASFSNWGAVSVDVAAPGTGIYSTSLDDSYAYSDGTSMSTAYVSGVAALIWSVDPALSYSQVRDRILLTGDSLAALSGKTVTGKRVNAYDALYVPTVVPVATLSNLPSATDTSATPSLDATVSGENTYFYKYKLDGSDWSEETSISVPITEDSLLNATHTLSVIAGSYFGLWQSEASSTDYTWLVEDTTAPDITGLADDSEERTEKAWSWSSDDPSATFRFEVSTSSIPLTLASSTYSDVIGATAGSPLGVIYLHVQGKDNNNNESAVTSVSAVLAEPAPAPAPPPPSSGGGGRGGGGGGGGGGGNTTVTGLAKPGDINADSKVDLLDFNLLMISWNSRPTAFLDFNSLMINWKP